LGRLNVVFDLITMIPQIPGHLPQFDDEIGSPSLASIATSQPNKVRFLNSDPFDRYTAFEGYPSNTILSLNRLL
jgi:hypothetical protein